MGLMSNVCQKFLEFDMFTVVWGLLQPIQPHLFSVVHVIKSKKIKCERNKNSHLPSLWFFRIQVYQLNITQHLCLYSFCILIPNFLFVETSVKFWRLVSCLWVNFQNNASVTKGIAKATIFIDSVRIECDRFIFDCILLISSCVYLYVGYAVLYAPSIHSSIDSM